MSKTRFSNPKTDTQIKKTKELLSKYNELLKLRDAVDRAVRTRQAVKKKNGASTAK